MDSPFPGQNMAQSPPDRNQPRFFPDFQAFVPNNYSLQGSQISIPGLSSLDDIDQNGVPSDIKALFDRQKTQTSIARSQERHPSFLSDSSCYFEEPGFSNTPGNIFRPSSSQNISIYLTKEPAQAEMKPLDISFDVVRQYPNGYNKICPFCGVAVSQEAFEMFNVLTLASLMQKRQYLTHKDCYFRSLEDASCPKIVSVFSLFQPRTNIYQSPAPAFNRNDYFADEKKTCFVSLEGFHPISSYLYFKIEKICYVQQHLGSPTQCLFLDLLTKTTNIFEPASYTVPLEEFRVGLTVYIPNEDPFRYDFLIDAVSISAASFNGSSYADSFYTNQGNSILLSYQVSNSSGLEPTEKLDNMIWNYAEGTPVQKNIKSSQQQQQQQPRNIQVTLRSLYINLPLKRVPYAEPQRKGEFSSNLPLYSPNMTPPNRYQMRDENLTERVFFSPPFYPPPGFSPNVPTLNNVKFNPSLGSLQNNSYSTLQGPSTASTIPDFGQYFKFQQDRPRNRAATCKLPEHPIPNKKVSFEQFEEFEDMEPKYETSPLLYPSNPSYQNFLSPMKTSSPPVNRSLERKESNVSESLSNSRHSGRLLSRLSTLGSEIDQMNMPTTQSTHGSELDQQSLQDLSKKESSDSFKIEDHIDNLEELAKSCQGSKVLQQFIVKATQQEIEMVIQKIGDKLQELMLDSYANYMVKAVMQKCSADQRYTLLQKIAPSMAKISCHKKGTHTLQVIVTLMNKESEYQLVKEALKNHIVNLAVDIYATHVIQKLITILPHSTIGFIFEPLVQNFPEVAKHSSGILVIKHLIRKVESVPDLKKEIINVILATFEELIQDQYGNYTIQYALEYYPDDCASILEKILVKVISYSSQKYTSNVIEKCVTMAPSQYLKRVINEMMKGDRLADLMKNKYGNYVLLHILISSDLEDKERIMQGINKNANLFQGTKYKQRWGKFIEDNPLNIDWSGLRKGEATSIGSKAMASRSGSNESNPNNEKSASKVKEVNLEKVKRVWREMNKNEKKEGNQEAVDDTFTSSETTPYSERHSKSNSSSNKAGWNKGKKEMKGKKDWSGMTWNDYSGQYTQDNSSYQ